jgi:hypothetical protein
MQTRLTVGAMAPSPARLGTAANGLL